MTTKTKYRLRDSRLWGCPELNDLKCEPHLPAAVQNQIATEPQSMLLQDGSVLWHRLIFKGSARCSECEAEREDLIKGRS